MPKPKLYDIIARALGRARPSAGSSAIAPNAAGRLPHADGSELALLRRENQQLRDQAAVIFGFFGINPDAVKGKSTDDVRGVIERAVSEATCEQVAALGFPASDLPTPTSNDCEIDGSISAYNDLLRRNPVEAARYYSAKIAPLMPAGPVARRIGE